MHLCRAVPSGGPVDNGYDVRAEDDRTCAGQTGDGAEADQTAAEQVQLHCERAGHFREQLHQDELRGGCSCC